MKSKESQGTEHNMKLFWATIPKNHPLRKYSKVRIYHSCTMLDSVEQHLGFLTDPEWCWDEEKTEFKMSEQSEPDLQVYAAWTFNPKTEAKTTWLKIVG